MTVRTDITSRSPANAGAQAIHEPDAAASIGAARGDWTPAFAGEQG